MTNESSSLMTTRSTHAVESLTREAMSEAAGVHEVKSSRAMTPSKPTELPKTMKTLTASAGNTKSLTGRHAGGRHRDSSMTPKATHLTSPSPVQTQSLECGSGAMKTQAAVQAPQT